MSIGFSLRIGNKITDKKNFIVSDDDSIGEPVELHYCQDVVSSSDSFRSDRSKNTSQKERF